MDRTFSKENRVYAEDGRVYLPGNWEMIFLSKYANERKAGSNSIPEILSHMPFLENEICHDVEYQICQFNNYGYIGILHNVCNFQILFQVNVKMDPTSFVNYLDFYEGVKLPTHVSVQPSRPRYNDRINHENISHAFWKTVAIQRSLQTIETAVEQEVESENPESENPILKKLQKMKDEEVRYPTFR